MVETYAICVYIYTHTYMCINVCVFVLNCKKVDCHVPQPVRKSCYHYAESMAVDRTTRVQVPKYKESAQNHHTPSAFACEFASCQKPSVQHPRCGTPLPLFSFCAGTSKALAFRWHQCQNAKPLLSVHCRQHSRCHGVKLLPRWGLDSIKPCEVGQVETRELSRRLFFSWSL